MKKIVATIAVVTALTAVVNSAFAAGTLTVALPVCTRTFPLPLEKNIDLEKVAGFGDGRYEVECRYDTGEEVVFSTMHILKQGRKTFISQQAIATKKMK